MKRIKVLRILSRLCVGGPAIHCVLLTQHLPKERYQSILLHGDLDEGDALYTYDHTQDMDIRLIASMKRQVGLKNIWKEWKSFLEVYRVIRAEKPDIIHTHTAKAGFIGRIAAYLAKTPVIVHTFHGHAFHSYFSGWKTNLFLSIERRLAKITHSIIAISQQQKHELGNVYKVCPPDKITVIPLGFDLGPFLEDKEAKRKDFRQQYKVKDDQIAVGLIGRMVPIKNHSLLIHAIAKIQQHKEIDLSKIRFFLIGDGAERKNIENLCTQLNIPFTDANSSDFEPCLVTFTGYQSRMDWVNAGLDIIVLTSKNEGTPVSLIEAQASGVPILSTRVGGVENIVLENETAILCSSDDVQEFAQKLIYLIQNPEKRSSMQGKGREYVLKNYHYSRLIHDIDKHYQFLLYGRDIHATKEN
ncbi:MAG: glycosyltransferase [Bacteroidia bacterium]|nr:glycosyltransferase [Bacteroidia bacterium]MDW8346419.1 glycosyltransferase [Bacteroidia bacterium]